MRPWPDDEPCISRMKTLSFCWRKTRRCSNASYKDMGNLFDIQGWPSFLIHDVKIGRKKPVFRRIAIQFSTLKFLLNHDGSGNLTRFHPSGPSAYFASERWFCDYIKTAYGPLNCVFNHLRAVCGVFGSDYLLFCAGGDGKTFVWQCFHQKNIVHKNIVRMLKFHLHFPPYLHWKSRPGVEPATSRIWQHRQH
jgi:hypothetical protein